MVEPVSRPSQSPSAAHIAVMFAAVYLIWGSTYLTIRIAVETMPPMLMAAARFTLAGVLLLAFMYRPGARHERLTWRQWRDATIIGGCLLLGGNGIVTWAEQYVATGYMALVVATVPLWMALLAPLFGGKRVGLIAAAGVAVGLVGTALLVHPSGGAFRWQSIAALGSPLLWSVGSLYARRAAMPRNALTATGMEMVTGGLLLFIVGAVAGEIGRTHLTAVSGGSWIAFVYLILFGSLVGYTAYIWLLGHVSATAVSTYAYVNPLVAVTLGAIVLGEKISPITLGAGAMIVFAVALILSDRARAQRKRVRVVEPSVRHVA